MKETAAQTIAARGMVPRTLLVLMAVTLPCVAHAGEPHAGIKLVRDKTLLKHQLDFHGQVSPDRKYLVYLQFNRGWGVVLRELSSGRETQLPGGLWHSHAGVTGEYEKMFRDRLFTLDGKRLLIPMQNGQQLKLAMYEIASGKTTDVGISAADLVACLDNRDERVYAYTQASGETWRLLHADLKSGKCTEMKVVGRPISPSALTGELPVARFSSVLGEGTLRQDEGLFLLDPRDADASVKLNTSTKGAQLLQEYGEMAWTANGRWLYYTDYAPDWPNPETGERWPSVVRIRDSKTKAQLKQTVSDAVVLGPGPTDSSVFLQIKDSLVLHDAATLQQVTVANVEVCWTDGRTVIYREFEKIDNDHDVPVYTIRMAEVAVSKTATGPATQPSTAAAGGQK